MFGGSLNPHPHFHLLVLDGVFAEKPNGLVGFHEATALTKADVEALTRTLHPPRERTGGRQTGAVLGEYAGKLALTLGCSPDPTGITTDAPAFSAFSLHGETVPFRADLEGTAQDPSSIVCPPGSFAGKFSLAGQATHLGQVTGDGSGCTAFTGPATFVFLAADNTIVAANGDELWLTLVSGGGSVVGFDPTTGPKLAWTAEKDIVGGTGRFAGATGRVTEVGTQDGVSAPSVSVLEGTISRVGAK